MSNSHNPNVGDTQANLIGGETASPIVTDQLASAIEPALVPPQGSIFDPKALRLSQDFAARAGVKKPVTAIPGCNPAFF